MSETFPQPTSVSIPAGVTKYPYRRWVCVDDIGKNSLAVAPYKVLLKVADTAYVLDNQTAYWWSGTTWVEFINS